MSSGILQPSIQREQLASQLLGTRHQEGIIGIDIEQMRQFERGRMRSSTGWPALGPTGVPEAPDVTHGAALAAETSYGKATPVDSKANQPGLPRCSS